MIVEKNSFSRTGVFLALVALSIFVGNRDFTSGADTKAYISAYQNTLSCMCFGSREYGFELISLLMAKLGIGERGFLTILSAIAFLLGMYFSENMARYIQKNINYPIGRIRSISLLLLGCLLISPMMISAQINGIRQGISSLSIMIFALELSKNKYNRAIYFALISITFHYSAVLYIASILGARLALPLLSVKKSLIILIALTIIYSLGVSEPIISSVFPYIHAFVDEYGTSAPNIGRLQKGVRVDFAIFTLVLIWLASSIRDKASEKIKKTTKEFFIYVMASYIPFTLLGWGYYSNRYLFTTWFLLVALLATIFIEPLVKRKLVTAIGWFTCGFGILSLVYEVA